jgi:copper chaperone CopZ
MKSFLLLLIGLVGIRCSAPAAEKKPPEPHPTTVTFYIDNVGCEACVESIMDALQKVRSVTAIKGLTADSGYANVSFDSHVNSYHEIANAIATAPPSHGKPYVPSIKLSIPEYAQGENAANVDKVFAKQSAHVKVDTTDRAKGEFVVHFLPLDLDPSKTAPQGFNGGHFGHPIHDAPPKGLGLKFAIAREDSKAPAPKVK